MDNEEKTQHLVVCHDVKYQDNPRKSIVAFDGGDVVFSDDALGRPLSEGTFQLDVRDASQWARLRQVHGMFDSIVFAFCPVPALTIRDGTTGIQRTMHLVRTESTSDTTAFREAIRTLKVGGALLLPSKPYLDREMYHVMVGLHNMGLRRIDFRRGERYAWYGADRQDPVVLQKWVHTVARWYHTKSDYDGLRELLHAIPFRRDLGGQGEISPRDLMHLFSALLLYEADPRAAQKHITDTDPLKPQMLDLLEAYEQFEIFEDRAIYDEDDPVKKRPRIK